MSQYSHERNGTYIGDPTMIGRTKTKDAGISANFKSGSPLKGIPAHEPSEFPKLPAYKIGGKELRKSTISKGSI